MSLLLALGLAANAAAAQQPWFEPVAAEALPARAVWRGVAWNDIDGDGDADLAASKSGGLAVYRNDSGRLLLAVDIGPEPGFDGEGVALVDVDGDRLIDLFVANRSGPPRLYRNTGGFRFAALKSDVDAVSASTHAGCFADFDGDGWLDLVLVTRDAADDLVFRNDKGRLTQVVNALDGSGGDGRTCAVGDWNGDRRPDIYIGNFLDQSRPPTRRALDKLYLNQGGFRFAALASGHVVNLPSMTYGATALDWNEDGKLDLAVTHDGRADRNLLYENRLENAGEVDLYPRGDELGLTTIQRGPSKGQVLADFDNDGDIDVFYAEGTEGLTAEHAPFDARDELHERAGDRFRHRREPGIDPEPRLGAGAASADFDLDGDVDLVVANWGGKGGELKQLYRNRAGGRSVQFILVSRTPNWQAIGAQVSLTVTREGRQLVRHTFNWPQTGYGSMSEPVAHFGLGQDDKAVSVTVDWPGGGNSAHPVGAESRIAVRSLERRRPPPRCPTVPIHRKFAQKCIYPLALSAG